MKKLLVLLLALVVSSCGQTSAENEAQGGKDTIVVTTYTIKGSPFHHVEKFIVEGHEYLVFSSKIANPPFVVHSESCPCKNMDGKK